MQLKTSIILTALLGLLLGGIAGWYSGVTIGFKNGRKSASDELVTRGILQPAPHGLTSLAGTVLRIDQEKQLLTVRVPQMISNPLTEQAPTERTVQVTADTTLLRQKQKKQQEYNKEVAAMQKQWERSSGAETSSEVSRFVETPIYLRDVAPESMVSIESMENILYTQTFKASRVILIAP